MSPSGAIDTDKATAKELQRLRRLPENRVCPNCLKEDRVGFGSVCQTFKTFVCNDCKSAHQSFSHRCKSVQMSVWTMEEVQALDAKNGGGNEVARSYYLARITANDRLKEDSTPEAYKRFIERAYIKKRWVAEDGEQVSAPVRSSAAELPPSEDPSGFEEKRSRRDGEKRRRSRRRKSSAGEESLNEASSGCGPPSPSHTAWTATTTATSASGALVEMSPRWDEPTWQHQHSTNSASNRSGHSPFNTPEQSSYATPLPSGINPWAEEAQRELKEYGGCPYANPSSFPVSRSRATSFFSVQTTSSLGGWATPLSGRATALSTPVLSHAVPMSRISTIKLAPTNPWAQDVLRLQNEGGAFVRPTNPWLEVHGCRERLFTF